MPFELHISCRRECAAGYGVSKSIFGLAFCGDESWRVAARDPAGGVFVRRAFIPRLPLIL